LRAYDGAGSQGLYQKWLAPKLNFDDVVLLPGAILLVRDGDKNSLSNEDKHYKLRCIYIVSLGNENPEGMTTSTSAILI
jgi:hypothetical protein